MKNLFLTLLMVLMSAAAMAVPAKRGMWTHITLGNGTEVRACLVGDEHGHWMRDEAGNCYVKRNGVYERADEPALQRKRQQRVAVRKKAISASTADGLGTFGQMSLGAVPSIGEFTIPVVMVQFSDLKFKTTTTVEKMERYYNEEGYSDEEGCVGSVRDYFKAQSGGKFVPTFHVVGIVTLPRSYKYYGANDSDGYDQNLDALPGDVVSAAVSQLGTDFSQYVVPAGDANHQAGVPLLAMFYAGRGEATEYYNGENYLWPCEWDAEEDPVGGGNYEGVHFNSFFIGNELASGGRTLMGMGIFCHEFGHALGLPDFYVTDYSYENDDPFGLWSIMDCGAYVDDDSRAPMGYTAYEKSYMGWLELKEVGDSDEVTLQLPTGDAAGSACIIRNSSTETFILENRQPATFYSSEFGTGVLLSRIAYSKNQWEYNTLNNTQSKKRACVLTADGGKLNYSAKQSNLYGNAKTSISSVKTYSGATKNLGIKKIMKNDDGTITLTLNEQAGPTPDPDPQPGPDGALFHETFDQCGGTGGNDQLWSGNIAVANFMPDNDGWTAEAMYGASQCARFGTTKKSGVATSPVVQLPNEAVLTFKAAPWGTDGTTLKLSAEGATVLFEPAEVTMTASEWTTFTVKLSGAGEARIVFTPAKRLFLDEVTIVGGETDGVQTVRTTTAAHRVYTLDGRYVGSDIHSLGHGLYIVDGRKVVR